MFIGCDGRTDGNYVKLRLEAAAALSAPVTRIELLLDLAGRTTTHPLQEPGNGVIALPTDATLRIVKGTGLLTVVAIARAIDGTELARGTGSVEVKQQRAVTLTLQLSPTGAIDGGTDLPIAPDLAASSPLSADPSALAFGEIATGNESAPVTVTITNTGTSAATLGNVDSSKPIFQIGSDACSGATVSANTTCTFTVTFVPTAIGPQTGTITLAGLTIAASGTGATPGALVPDPSAHPFGDFVRGGTPPSQSITITNTGGAESGALTVSAPIGDSPQFTVMSTACAGQSLAPAGSCTIILAYDPQMAGSHSATIEVTSPDAGKATISVSGRAIDPAQLVVTALDGTTFTDTVIGEPRTLGFLVQNSGDLSFALAPVVSFGTGAALLTVASNTCTSALILGGSCGFSVVYDPATSESFLRNLVVVVDGAAGSPATLPLSGSAITPVDLVALPTTKNFMIQRVGVDSTTQVFVITNQGMEPAVLPAFTLTGMDPGDFKILTSTADDCAAQTLLLGESCNITVVFSPQSVGMKNALLTLAGSTLDPLTLSGEGYTCTDNDGDGAVTDFPAYCGGPGGVIPDCDDADTNIWGGCSGTACKDLDNDGFFAGCNRYLTKMPDCNDSNYGVTHTPETISNGIDDDCDGSDITEASGIFVSEAATDDAADPTDGTKANPVRTLTKALDLAAQRGLRAIFIHGDITDMPPTIQNRSITLFGGFTSAMVRHVSNSSTIFNSWAGTTLALSGPDNSGSPRTILGLDRVILDGGKIGIDAANAKIVLRNTAIRPGSVADSIGIKLGATSRLESTGGSIYGGSGVNATGIEAHRSFITLDGGTVYGASLSTNPGGSVTGIQLDDPYDVQLTNVLLDSGNGNVATGLRINDHNNGAVYVVNSTIRTGTAVNQAYGILVNLYHNLHVHRSKILPSSSGSPPTAIFINNGEGTLVLTSSVAAGSGVGGSGLYVLGGTGEMLIANNYITSGTSGNPAAIALVGHQSGADFINNYVVTSAYGIELGAGTSSDSKTVRLLNNVFSGASCVVSAGGCVSSFDCTSQTFPRCTTSQSNATGTCTFDASYNLSSSDTACKAAGVDPTTLGAQPFTDLQDQSRPQGSFWDVGPDDIASGS